MDQDPTTSRQIEETTEGSASGTPNSLPEDMRDIIEDQNQDFHPVSTLGPSIGNQETVETLQSQPIQPETPSNRPPAQCLRNRRGPGVKASQVKPKSVGAPKKSSRANSHPTSGISMLRINQNSANQPIRSQVNNFIEPREGYRQRTNSIVSDTRQRLDGMEHIMNQLLEITKSITSQPRSERAQPQPSESEANANPDHQDIPSRREREVIIQTVKPVSPPHFSGECSEALTWLLKFKRTADQNKWSETTKCLHVGESLDAGAQSWYFSLWETSHPTSWTEFEQQFQDTFLDGDLKCHIRDKLSSFKQKKDQSVIDYFFEAIAICNMIRADISELEKVRYTLRGLAREPRKMMKLFDPRTMLELQHKLMTWHNETPATKTSKDDKTDKAQASKPKLRPREDNWCVSCGQKGHYRKDCPKPQGQEAVNKRQEEWKKNPPFRSSPKANTSKYLHSNEIPQSTPTSTPQTSSRLYQTPPEGLEVFGHLSRLTSQAARCLGQRSPFECKVNGLLTRAVLDTGSTLTVVPLAIIEETGTDLYEWKWRDLSLADGSPKKPTGWCQAVIEYRDRSFTVPAAVMEGSPEVLIGEDFLKKSGLVLSYTDNSAMYHDEYVNQLKDQIHKSKLVKTKETQTSPIKFSANEEISSKRFKLAPEPLYIEYPKTTEHIRCNRLSDQPGKQTIEDGLIRSTREVVIPARSRARLEVKISGDSNSEPHEIQAIIRKCMLIPGIVKRQSTVVELHNFGKNPVTIETNELLGKAVQLSRELEESTQVRIPQDLSDQQRDDLKMLLSKHEKLFVTNNVDIGVVPFIKHEINTGEAIPVRSRPYRVSLKEQQVIQKMIDEMLEAGVIRPSKSPWAMPVVLVKKKDTDELRFCIDYRKLNKITVIDPYPIPNMDSVLELISGNHWFSKLDVKAMYWQVLMREQDRQKTAFVVHCGHYEFNVMPFGLVSAPMTAMRVMNEVTKGMETKCFVFYDDILIFTPDFTTHLDALEELFQRLTKANIRLNAKKCDLTLNSIKYLGHIVTPRGIQVDPEKVQTINNFKKPQNITEARSFIGMCNFFRRYIRGFATIAKPIHNCIKPKEPFEWTIEAQQAMDKLKALLMQPPILVHYDSEGELTIRCDASGYGIGAVLKQKSNLTENSGVIAYYSKTLNKHEMNYATTHKEALAVVSAIVHWRHYVYGRHFHVITDHHALCWLMKAKDPAGQLMRWALKLQEYQFTIHYESGKQHGDADCLSRQPLEAAACKDIDTEIPTWPIHSVRRSRSTRDALTINNQSLVTPVYDVKAEQENDKFCKSILENLTSRGKTPSKFKSYVVIDGVLHKKSRWVKPYLLVLPQSMIQFVLTEAHDKPSGGHFGIKRTIHTVKTRFYWKTLESDVKNYVQTCDLCQRKKSNSKRNQGFMIPMPIPKQSFEIIGLDLIGPLPRSTARYEHIVVMTDYLSKYVIAEPIRAATTNTIIEVLNRTLLYKFGKPNTIITDNGSNLTSTLMREYLKSLEITHKTTSPYRPQTNGQTERYNRVLGTQLAIFANEKHKSWDCYVDALAFAYNTTVHSSHLMTPFYIVFGREATKTIDNIVKTRYQHEEVTIQMEIREEARKLARTLVKQAQFRQKRAFDKNRIAPSYKLGDIVIKRIPVLTGDRKFQLTWSRPLRIIAIISDKNYQLQDVETKSEQIAHIDQIKLYKPRRLDPQEGAATTQVVCDQSATKYLNLEPKTHHDGCASASDHSEQ